MVESFHYYGNLVDAFHTKLYIGSYNNTFTFVAQSSCGDFWLAFSNRYAK